MSKSRIKDDYYYEEGEARAARLARKPKKNKRSEKRVIRALKTKNIDDLLQYDEESGGDDAIISHEKE